MRMSGSKYLRVRALLLARVRLLPAGARLPAEPELCAEYGVSRITLRHAVDGLIDEGFLVREQGRGTFVTEPQRRMRYRERFAGAVTGFHAQQTAQGFVVTSQVAELAERAAREPAAGRLGLAPGDRVARLTRVRSVAGAVHHLAVTELPLDRFPGILDSDLTDASLFATLRDHHGVDLARNDLLVSIRGAEAEVAEHLFVEPGERLLTVESTVFDADDRPVASGVSWLTPRNSEVAFSLRP